MIDGAAEFLDGGGVVFLGCLHETVTDMVLQDDAAHAAQRGADSGQLDQDFRTVTAVLHHALHRLQMSDGAGDSVEHRLRFGMGVRVAVVMFMLMLMRVFVLIHEMQCFHIVPPYKRKKHQTRSSDLLIPSGYPLRLDS